MSYYMKWTEQIRRTLHRRFPGHGLLIGGDFNVSRGTMGSVPGIYCVVCFEDLDKLYTSWLPWRFGEVDGSFSDHDAFWARVLRPAKP